MEKQKGVSLSGLIVALFVVIMVAMLGFKLFVPYTQYFTIQKVFKQLAANPELKSGSRKEVISAFAKFAMVEDFKAITGDDIEVTKDSNGIVISAAYTVKVPLFHNISLVIDFAPSSGK